MRTSTTIALLAPLLVVAVADAQDRRGAANAGIPLRESHGPIMVKVASFTGSSARVFANALTEELRETAGIDAYAFNYKPTINRASAEERAVFKKRYGVAPRTFNLRTEPPDNYVVLAGHFDSFEDKAAQKLLKRVRGIDPKSVPAEIRSRAPSLGRLGELQFESARSSVFEAGYRDRGKKRRAPLSTAMLVRNPLSRRPVRPSISRETAYMLKSLNDKERYSVYNLKEPHTIQVAMFRGISVLDNNDKKSKSLIRGNFFRKDKSMLRKAANNAVVLTERLRATGVEAYVFHGQFASLVFVGGYTSPEDPRLMQDLEKLSKIRFGGISLGHKLAPTPRRPG